MTGRFENKVALIAGGAHAVEGELMGFGGVAAWEIVRGGGKLVIADIDDVSGEQSVEQMRSAGFEALYIHADVTSEADWVAAVELATSTHGHLDIMVMVAGAPDRRETIESASVDDWKRVMDVTNLGMFLGVRTVAPAMRDAGGGSIVLISSMMAKIAGSYANAYAASRAGMTQFARSAAVQLGPDNIRVNTVLPGWTVTPFTAPIFDDETIEQLSERVPLGRLATSREIAAGILFLASDESSYVTGSELLMDGGVTSWLGPQ
ncbi:MAG: SDR family oxidoreductase [Chloroflexi bacterium]|nr:SDR family oxidoreductase [Chloroflexota bacterium]